MKILATYLIYRFVFKGLKLATRKLVFSNGMLD